MTGVRTPLYYIFVTANVFLKWSDTAFYTDVCSCPFGKLRPYHSEVLRKMPNGDPIVQIASQIVNRNTSDKRTAHLLHPEHLGQFLKKNNQEKWSQKNRINQDGM